MTHVTIAAIVGVCDEHELIETCISHLETLNVSILVVDNGSTDGTLEILDGMEREGRIELVRNSRRRDEKRYVLDMAFEEAQRRFAPDWVFFQDADEFLVPSTDLRTFLADRAPCVFTVERYNACLTPRLLSSLMDVRPDIASLDLHTQALYLDKEVVQDDKMRPWITGRDAGKVLVASELVGTIAKGAHFVLADGKTREATTTDEIVIVHVPFSTFERFERKIENVETLMAANENLFPLANMAWHWKRWITQARQGRLREEYDRQVSQPEALEASRASGTVSTASALFETARDRGRQGWTSLFRRR